MPVFGLIGKNLGHSFSKAWFTAKFEREGSNNHHYINIEIPDLLPLKNKISELQLNGFNVTIPYKEIIIPFLDELSSEAKMIGAVNTVKIKNGKLIGYNTDYIGFTETIKPLLKPYHTLALLLGTGGVSKAIAFSLQSLGIEYEYISRKQSEPAPKNYAQLTFQDIRNATLIINTTPLGSYPAVDEFPDIPYQGIDKQHLLFDVIYNPAQTEFLKRGALRGASTMNGYPMLIRQAEESWKIWKEDE